MTIILNLMLLIGFIVLGCLVFLVTKLPSPFTLIYGVYCLGLFGLFAVAVWLVNK